MKGEDIGSCPFCGGHLAVSENPPAVIHSLPTCEQFNRDEPPAAFLAAVRAAREAQR